MQLPSSEKGATMKPKQKIAISPAATSWKNVPSKYANDQPSAYTKEKRQPQRLFSHIQASEDEGYLASREEGGLVKPFRFLLPAFCDRQQEPRTPSELGDLRQEILAFTSGYLRYIEDTIGLGIDLDCRLEYITNEMRRILRHVREEFIQRRIEFVSPLVSEK